MRSVVRTVSVLFSEPKIPQFAYSEHLPTVTSAFQCSSASRKFLNSARPSATDNRFSVSVLFSEPKIPQSNAPAARTDTSRFGFSALQRAENSSMMNSANSVNHSARFSALQRAENSSIAAPRLRSRASRPFQCSSASRKFLNLTDMKRWRPVGEVSVLFSEPKIPQSRRR